MTRATHQHFEFSDFKHILHLNADDANSVSALYSDCLYFPKSLLFQDDIIEFLTGQKVPGSPISSHFDALESKGTIV